MLEYVNVFYATERDSNRYGMPMRTGWYVWRMGPRFVRVTGPYKTEEEANQTVV